MPLKKDGFYYEDNTFKRIIDIDEKYDFKGTIMIPENTTIAKGTFSCKTFENKIDTLIIPPSVKIEQFAFMADKEEYGKKPNFDTIPENGIIKNLILEDGWEEIPPSAFEKSVFEEVVLPPSLKKICFQSFADSNLKHIDFNNVSVIEQRSFRNSNIKGSITITEKMNELDEYAFEWCEGLSEVIYNSKKDIEKCLFQNCRNIKRVIINSDIKEIKNSAFSGCTSLNYINWPKSLKLIGIAAFYNADFKTVIIPDGVEKIEDYAFKSCDQLESVKFNSNLKFLGGSIFENTKIKELIIPETVIKLDRVCSGMTELEKLYVYANVDSLPSNFANHTINLKTLVLNDTITKLDDYAFLYSGIEEFDFSNIKEVGKRAFSYSHIKHIIIPSDILLYDSSFNGMDDLETAIFLSKERHNFTEPIFGFAINNNLKIFINEKLSDTKFAKVYKDNIILLSEKNLEDLYSLGNVRQNDIFDIINKKTELKDITDIYSMREYTKIVNILNEMNYHRPLSMDEI